MVSPMSGAQWAGRRLHFIGIGGAGMSGLALVARALGAEVTGSDRAESSYCDRLRAAGLEPAIGHDPANLPPGATVVVSTAIAEDNPELAAARELGLEVLHRGDLLGEVSRLKRCIAIGGAHGKTTTAAMAAHVLAECERDPAYLVGGELRSTGSNAAWSDGDLLVVEADESDRSFLKLARDVTVVTNVELDHHSTYRSLLELERAFGEFVAPAPLRILRHGLVYDRGRLYDAGSDAGRIAGEPALTFGIGAGALAATDVESLRLGSRFRLAEVPVELGVPGPHNVLNALAAIAVAREAGIEPADAAAALASFPGVARRFEAHGMAPSGALVFDDYAHHPTELAATLEAARGLLDGGRLVACFQPHLYSRTRRLAREFGRALALADVVVVLDVYPARERAEDFPGVSGWLVATAAADAAGGRPVYWAPTMDEAEELLRGALADGDVLVTLGAGDVDRLAERFAASVPTAAETAS
jgi:UDP-N-acetylmuramate--alanine ligase